MESSSVVSQKLVVSGEDEESEGEIDIEFEKPVVVVPVTDPTLMSAAKLAGREQIPVSTGEAPESDIEGILKQNVYRYLFVTRANKIFSF